MAGGPSVALVFAALAVAGALSLPANYMLPSAPERQSGANCVFKYPLGLLCAPRPQSEERDVLAGSPEDSDDDPTDRRVLVIRQRVAVPLSRTPFAEEGSAEEPGRILREQLIRYRINRLRLALGLPPLSDSSSETPEPNPDAESVFSPSSDSSSDGDTPDGTRRLIVIQGPPRITGYSPEGGIQVSRPTLVVSVPAGQSGGDSDEADAERTGDAPKGEDSEEGPKVAVVDQPETPDDSGEPSNGKRRILIIQGAPRITGVDSDGDVVVARPTLILAVPAEQGDGDSEEGKEVTPSSTSSTTTTDSNEDDLDVANRGTTAAPSKEDSQPSSTEPDIDVRTNASKNNEDIDSAENEIGGDDAATPAAPEDDDTTVVAETTPSSSEETSPPQEDNETTTSEADAMSREELDIPEEVEWLQKKSGSKPERQIAAEESRRYFAYEPVPHAMTV